MDSFKNTLLHYTEKTQLLQLLQLLTVSTAASNPHQLL